MLFFVIDADDDEDEQEAYAYCFLTICTGCFAVCIYSECYVVRLLVFMIQTLYKAIMIR